MRDSQNAIAGGRDKKLGEMSGTPTQSLLKSMLKFETVYCLMCDVYHYLDQLAQILKWNLLKGPFPSSYEISIKIHGFDRHEVKGRSKH